MKTLPVTITGIRPLLLHNGLMADPTNEIVRAMKKITTKGSKKMTDSDHIERDRLEWVGSLYWSDELGAIALPPDNLERCILEGAKKNRLGKDFAAALFVQESEVEVKHRMSGKSKEAMRENASYTLRKGVKVQLNRVIRVRPMIPPGWTASFTLEYDDSIISEGDVKNALREAGSLVGLGDWRPKFGRFSVDF